MNTLLVTDGLYAIDEGGVRAFLAVGDARCALIDSGFGKTDLRASVRAITSLPVDLYLTHADPDHTGGANAFAEVTLHPGDRARFEKNCPGFKGQINLWYDGEELDVSPHTFRVIHIPGHTPGSVALLEPRKRYLLPGDSASLAPIFMFGDGRDVNEYARSLEQLCALSNEFDVMYPSHGALPVDSEILSELLEGARKLRAGALAPETPPMPLPCKLYAYKRARFLA